MAHVSVLQNEILTLLDPKTGESFIDCTINGGGHAEKILKRVSPHGKLLGIDMDKGALETLETKRIKNLVLAQGNFKNLEEIARRNNFLETDGILFDLGLSTNQLQGSERGFSFLRDEPLDMRFDTSASLTAEEIVNSWPKEKIKEILKEFGEEGFFHQIGDAIYRERKKKRITRTGELVTVIERTVPAFYKHKRIHSATKTFQALRIAVNDELENLRVALPQALGILKKGGRIAVISFHGLEDKIVKDFIKNGKDNRTIEPLAKKPIRAGREEIMQNPNARSAKLRGAKKI